jgi:hypothetical protein
MIDDLVVARPKTKSQKFLLRLFILIFCCSTTYAASVSLGSGRAEFGQGLFHITACDQWVKISYGYIYNAGNAFISQVNIDSLDTQSCKGKNFRIKLYNSSGSQLNLFRDNNRSVNVSSVWLTINASGKVGLLNSSGAFINDSDDYQYLNYLENSARYEVIFYDNQTGLMSDFSSMTLESANNA